MIVADVIIPGELVTVLATAAIAGFVWNIRLLLSLDKRVALIESGLRSKD